MKVQLSAWSHKHNTSILLKHIVQLSTCPHGQQALAYTQDITVKAGKNSA